jgi:hypothetical protein
MVSQRLGKAIREEQRARWVELLLKSSEEAGLPVDAEFRAAFVAYLEWGSRIGLESSQPGAHPPPHMPVPRWWWVCDATPGRRVSALAASDAVLGRLQAGTMPCDGAWSPERVDLFRRWIESGTPA